MSRNPSLNQALHQGQVSPKRRLAALGLFVAFVAGFQLLPVAHFAFCSHDLALDGQVVHTGRTCNSDSHTTHDEPTSASQPVQPSGSPRDSGESASDHCAVFQALQQSAEELAVPSVLFLVLRAVPVFPEMRSQDWPASFKRYLLAPATSPPNFV